MHKMHVSYAIFFLLQRQLRRARWPIVIGLIPAGLQCSVGTKVRQPYVSKASGLASWSFHHVAAAFFITPVWME